MRPDSGSLRSPVFTAPYSTFPLEILFSALVSALLGDDKVSLSYQKAS